MTKIFIKFRSTPENFRNEHDGSKPNTVRITEFWNDVWWQLYKKATHIRIINTKTKDIFEREITNKTLYRNMAIISWKHESGSYPISHLCREKNLEVLP